MPLFVIETGWCSCSHGHGKANMAWVSVPNDTTDQEKLAIQNAVTAVTRCTTCGLADYLDWEWVDPTQ